jgi:hypothetical protein
MYLYGGTVNTFNPKCICSAARQIHCICDLYIYPPGRIGVALAGGASCLDDRAKRCKKLVDTLRLLNYYLHMP